MEGGGRNGKISCSAKTPKPLSSTMVWFSEKNKNRAEERMKVHKNLDGSWSASRRRVTGVGLYWLNVATLGIAHKYFSFSCYYHFSAPVWKSTFHIKLSSYYWKYNNEAYISSLENQHQNNSHHAPLDHSLLCSVSALWQTAGWHISLHSGRVVCLALPQMWQNSQ